jgi:hypothetical protein
MKSSDVAITTKTIRTFCAKVSIEGQLLGWGRPVSLPELSKLILSSPMASHIHVRFFPAIASRIAHLV